jgi:TolB-like protein
MNTATINYSEASKRLLENGYADPEQIANIGVAVDGSDPRQGDKYRRSHGLLHFVSELRRRQVCRTATLYAVAMWLICQVVELVYLELGLPEWTLRFVILIGLLGLPITLILSWLIDITPDGLVIDNAAGADANTANKSRPIRRIDQIIDCSLVLAALVIGVQLATGALSTDSVTAPSRLEKIAVVTFRAASGHGAEVLSEELAIELQHELVTQTGLTIIAPKDPALVIDSLRLVGAVAIGEHYVHITAMLVENETNAVKWSKAFKQLHTDSLAAPLAIAQEIVAALPEQYRISSASQVDHAT